MTYEYPKIQQVSPTEYILLDDCACTVHTGKTLLVKYRFRYDGLSIPRWCWSLLGMSPFTGKYASRISLIHDALYSIEYNNDRQLCDDIFLNEMQKCRLLTNRRNIMYRGVRLVQ